MQTQSWEVREAKRGREREREREREMESERERERESKVSIVMTLLLFQVVAAFLRSATPTLLRPSRPFSRSRQDSRHLKN
jgi:hypothetical protein